MLFGVVVLKTVFPLCFNFISVLRAEELRLINMYFTLLSLIYNVQLYSSWESCHSCIFAAQKKRSLFSVLSLEIPMSAFNYLCIFIKLFLTRCLQHQAIFDLQTKQNKLLYSIKTLDSDSVLQLILHFVCVSLIFPCGPGENRVILNCCLHFCRSLLSFWQMKFCSPLPAIVWFFIFSSSSSPVPKLSSF